MGDSAIRKWVEKAEEDWQGIERLQGGSLLPVADLVCFLAQQRVEKYLKSLIEKAGLPPPRTHELEDLLDWVVSDHEELESWRMGCKFLSQFAVAFRYPGKRASEDFAMRACEAAGRIRGLVRAILKLD
ncbi:MAG: HEPN domain-containing protein [Candidatus Sumerlaeota bacterium]|nr:HEPN domain-containing protein [Candidatus Sumerlaeota bacterium]